VKFSEALKKSDDELQALQPATEVPPVEFSEALKTSGDDELLRLLQALQPVTEVPPVEFSEALKKSDDELQAFEPAMEDQPVEFSEALKKSGDDELQALQPATEVPPMELSEALKTSDDELQAFQPAMEDQPVEFSEVLKKSGDDSPFTSPLFEQAKEWARRMAYWLKDESHGEFQALQSTTAGSATTSTVTNVKTITDQNDQSTVTNVKTITDQDDQSTVTNDQDDQSRETMMADPPVKTTTADPPVKTTTDQVTNVKTTTADPPVKTTTDQGDQSTVLDGDGITDQDLDQDDQWSSWTAPSETARAWHDYHDDLVNPRTPPVSSLEPCKKFYHWLNEWQIEEATALENKAYGVQDMLIYIKGYPNQQLLNAAAWKVLRWLWDVVTVDTEKGEFEAKQKEMEDTVEAILLGQSEGTTEDLRLPWLRRSAVNGGA